LFFTADRQQFARPGDSILEVADSSSGRKAMIRVKQPDGYFRVHDAFDAWKAFSMGSDYYKA